MNYRCVIFDMDGTLADTIDDLTLNINKALEERGFAPAPAEKYLKMQGREIDALVTNALPRGPENPGLVKELAERAIAVYSETPHRLTRVYPGIPELLLELKRKKIKRAALSNKPDRMLNAEIAFLFPPGTFEAAYGARPGIPAKPDPAAVWELLSELDVTPRDTILAGDSGTDIKTALAAGCHALGVSWGYRSVPALKAAGAQRIIHEPRELLELL
ncbi:MAG: HAD family hydrolase [Treponema sp.]|jgi:phosphoglycolate phosphatase|nr:HAD family hydrolase [Treponema sp.]